MYVSMTDWKKFSGSIPDEEMMARLRKEKPDNVEVLWPKGKFTYP